MRVRYPWYSYLILGLLLFVWLFVFITLVSDLREGRLAGVGIFVSPHAEGVEVVAFREGASVLYGLQVGDVLTHAGDQPVPASQFGFRSAFLNAAGVVTLIRDGRERTLQVPLEQRHYPILSLTSAALWVALGLAVYFVGQPGYNPNLGGFALLVSGIAQSTSNGPSEMTIWVNALANAVSGGVVFCLLINWFQSLDNRRVSVWRFLAPWLLAPIIGLGAFSMFYGAPIPAPYGVLTAMIGSGVGFVLVFCVVLWIYPRARVEAQQSLGWILFAGSANTIGAVGCVIAFSLTNDRFYIDLGTRGVQIIFPLIMLLGLMRIDLLKIDRVVGVTVTYAILAVALALAIEFVAEPLAGVAAATFGLSERLGQTILIVVLALAGPRARQFIEPYVQRYLFGETRSAPPREQLERADIDR